MTTSSPAVSDSPFTEGSVWGIAMIRTTDGLDSQYLENQRRTYKPLLEEAKKRGIILSYKFIGTPAVGPDDWNILVLTEYKNWAALDGFNRKWEALAREILGQVAQPDFMTKNISLRRILGSKFGTELILR